MEDKIFNFLINYFSNINDRGVDEMNNFRGDITSDEIVEWLKNIQNTSSKQPSEDFKGEFDDYLVHGDIRNPNFEGPFGYDDIRKTAIHFAQWQKEQLINKACNWFNQHVVDHHPRTGQLKPVVNINAFREAMEKEDE